MKRRGFLRIFLAACSAPLLSRANPQPEAAPAVGVEPVLGVDMPWCDATDAEVLAAYAEIPKHYLSDAGPEVYGRGRSWISDLPHLRAKPLNAPGPASCLFQGALRPEGPWHDIQSDGKLENLYGIKEQWSSIGSVAFEEMPVADQAWWNEWCAAPLDLVDIHDVERQQFELMAFGSTAVRIS